MRSRRNIRWTVGVLAVLALPAAAADLAPADVATVQLGGGAATFVPLALGGSLSVTLTGPGVALRKELPPGQTAIIRAGEGGQPWADGQYRYELRTAPPGGPASRAPGAAAVRRERRVQSGGFRVKGGAILAGAPAVADASPSPTFLVDDNLYVTGRTCLGPHCVNDEALTETLRFKDPQIRLRFHDTDIAGPPSNDWQITINDAGAGGMDRFSIEDVSFARIPFTLEAGAPENAFYLDANGRLGLRTATPMRDLHVISDDTPTLRLEQNFAIYPPRTWDVEANEIGFLIRDVDTGNAPFLIAPDAIPAALVVGDAGNVGVGGVIPAAALHVSRGDGGTQVFIENVAGPTQTRRLLDLKNNGGVRMRLSDSSTGTTWAYQNIATEFLIDANGGTNEFRLSTAGNLTISGTLSQNSDRNLKTAIRPVDTRTVLEKVAALPITTWSYKADKETVRHVGPMAQDFAAAFGVGVSDRTLAPGDVAGVALAAIQALKEELAAARREIADLRAGQALQAARLAELETLRDVRLQEVHQVLDGHRLVEHGDAHP